jgi:mannitol/fructose-specific phosphotransferase system IIA component
MKRDYTTIRERIQNLGITNVHVAKQLKMHQTNLAKYILGITKNKEQIEKIHAYLDKCKTRIKDFPKEK